MDRLSNLRAVAANHQNRTLDIGRSLFALDFEILEIAHLSVNQFVTFEIRSDVSIAGDHTKSARDLIEPDPVALGPRAFLHCTALGAREECNSQGLVSVGVGGSEFATVFLKMVILGLLVRESMNWWHISPAFASRLLSGRLVQRPAVPVNEHLPNTP